jgi:rubrerythrin
MATTDPTTSPTHDVLGGRIPDGGAFLTALAASPAGREYLLSIAVDAEEGDEAGRFDQAAAVVDVPELRRVVETHRDDEVRHAGLYRDCLARNGYTKRELPASVSFISQVGDGSSDPHQRIQTTDDLVPFFALLLAIEERGVERFAFLADAFEPHDPETAAVYRRVTRDERGHVRYCQRLGRHYAGSDEAWEAAVAVAREAEAMAFIRAGLAQVTYCIEQGLVDADDELLPAG